MPKFVPLLIPKGSDEESRRNIVNRLNELGRHVANSNLRTEDMDLQGNKVQNVQDPGAPTDAVNLRTLRKHIQDIAIQQVRRQASSSGGVGGYYSMCFTCFGSLTAGQVVPPYIVMPNRTGIPVSAKIACASQGTGTADCRANIIHIVGSATTTLLLTDLVLPTGQTGPITVTNFLSPTPAANVDDMFRVVITTAGGAAYVTVELEIQAGL